MHGCFVGSPSLSEGLGFLEMTSDELYGIGFQANICIYPNRGLGYLARALIQYAGDSRDRSEALQISEHGVFASAFYILTN